MYIFSINERSIQVHREACGGHMFLVATGLVRIHDTSCSAEGDGIVLFQQTVK